MFNGLIDKITTLQVAATSVAISKLHFQLKRDKTAWKIFCRTLSEKMVLSRTKKDSSANALLEPLKSSK